MATFILLLLGAALANNAVLGHLYGTDPAIRGQGRLRDALAVALAVACVLVAAAVACWLLDRFVLAPLHAGWLRALAWLLAVAALAPLPGMFPRRGVATAATPAALSPWLLLGNGLLLGTIATSGQAADGFAAMLARAFGAAIGFGIVLLLFTALRDRLDGADVPAPFRGAPILLLTAALMALAFMGFAAIGTP